MDPIASPIRSRVLQPLARAASRRAALGGALAALAAAGAGRQPDAAGKKKKKKVCVFTKTATTWTLQKDCTATQVIQIDQSVTVDGGGHTISLKGDAGTFRMGLYVASQTVTIRNLVVDGSGVKHSGTCSGPLSAIRFANASGRVENVAVRNLLPQGECLAHGIHVDRFGSPPAIDVAVVQSTVEDIGQAGIRFELSTGGSVADSAIRRCPYGIHLDNTRPTTVERNTLVGPDERASFGILVNGRGGTTAVNDNAVSGYADPGPPAPCGINVLQFAVGVTLSGNTFPAPGNEQDVCDRR